jgi:hypothetical protein
MSGNPHFRHVSAPGWWKLLGHVIDILGGELLPNSMGSDSSVSTYQLTVPTHVTLESAQSTGQDVPPLGGEHEKPVETSPESPG